MSTFAGIPIRTNNDDILASWFNVLRQAGVDLAASIPSDFLPPVQFAIPNNQSSATDVTGLLLDGTTYRSAKIDVTIYRKTSGAGNSAKAERRTYLAVYNTVAGTWEMGDMGGVGDSGTPLSIVPATGQVQYTSDNMTTGTSYDTANSKLWYSISYVGV